jgi:hypothetical protein
LRDKAKAMKKRKHWVLETPEGTFYAVGTESQAREIANLEACKERVATTEETIRARFTKLSTILN